MNRRKFVRNSLYTAALAGVNTLPLSALAYDHDVVRLTILHTNDVHSRVEAFPDDGSRNANQGGASRRAALIDSIRKQEKNVLLFDSGDIFQGTPYFNVFGGEIEFKLMTAMKYDAATMGNHDFDGGMDGFVKQLPHADFPFITSNYDFSDTPIKGKTEKYKTWMVEDMKIGLYGLGIELDGLVAPEHYGDTQYLDPITVAREYERMLREEMKCDYVICLSHLGYRYRDDKVSDIVLAKQTYHTDLILGGHTHTFMRQPDVQENLSGHPVFINQAGWAGILLGRVDIVFERGTQRRRMNSQNVIVQ